MRPEIRPLAEAKLMRDALKRSQVVFQLGHQARQATSALQAKELLAQDILGPITLVRTGRCKASDPAYPNWRWYGYYDQWDRPDPVQVVKEVNWDLWLGPAPKIPWNERHFWHWRCYWAYGTGYAGDLLSHEMDFVQYVLGHGIPDNCNCCGLISHLPYERWIAAEPAQSTVTPGCVSESRVLQSAGYASVDIRQAADHCLRREPRPKTESASNGTVMTE